MVSSKSLSSLFCTLAVGIIPQIFASTIDLENGLQARDGPKPILVPWEHNVYLQVNITVGSQKTPFLVSWDTGSNDLWLINSNVTCILCIGENKDCTNDTTACKEFGTFDPLNSTTFVDLHQNWSIEYDFGDTELGGWGTDQVGIGKSPVTVEDFEFAVADYAYNQPFMGMGVNASYGPNYLPSKLKAQGHITKAAFSYWHDSLLSETGSFLLGGLDEAKYKGDLVAVPVIDNDSSLINLTTIVVGGVPFPQFARGIIDTGSPQLFLPPPVLANITTELGGSLDSWDGSFFSIPCDQGNKTIEFVFNNATIVVPLSEFIQLEYENPDGTCPFEVGRDKYYLIGVQVQKYAYWVFDQDDQTISIAKPTFSKDSKIVNL